MGLRGGGAVKNRVDALPGLDMLGWRGIGATRSGVGWSCRSPFPLTSGLGNRRDLRRAYRIEIIMGPSVGSPCESDRVAS